MRPRGGGFTLVELLVVITIIALLMALIFPAIGQVKEAVNRNKCGGKIRDIGIAMENYLGASNNYYPSVSTEPVAKVKPGAVDQNKAAGYSWIVSILPRLGRDDLYRDIAVTSKNYKLKAFDPKNVEQPSGAQNKDDNQKGSGGSGNSNDSTLARHWSTRRLSQLECPSFKSDTLDFMTLAPEYSQFINQSEESAPAITNYVAMSATHITLIEQDQAQQGTGGAGGGATGGNAQDQKRKTPNGILVYRRNKGRREADIVDGKDKTILLVETREPKYSAWMDGSTAWVVAHDPNEEDPTLDPTKNQWQGIKHALNVGPDMANRSGGEQSELNYRKSGGNWSGQEPWQYGPSSFHSGGLVMHVFADQHAKGIVGVGPRSIDPTVYLHLVTVADKEQLNPDDYQ